MESRPDPRFRSFLWSQTRKRVYAETRLTMPEAPFRPPEAPTAPVPAPADAQAAAGDDAAAPNASPAEAAAQPEGLPKRKLTPLEQAAMRLSEHCLPPRQPDAESQDGDAPAPAQTVERAWQLHVLRRQVEAAVPPRLNVRTLG